MKKIIRLVVVLIMSALFAVSAFAAAPGLNVLTGTKEPMTFDDVTTLPSNVKNAVLDDSPISGENGKVLRHYTGESITSTYGTVGFAFSPALDRNRPYQISFKAYKWSSDTSIGVKNTQLWIMKNGTAGWQIAKSIGSFASGKSGWYEHSYDVTTFGSLTNSSTGALDTTDINTIYFEWQYDSLSSYNNTEKIYVDDVSIIPAYKVTYLDEDGAELKVTYEFLTDSSFTPVVTPTDSNNGIIGWSNKNDGTADDEIILNNTDLTLYAVYDNKLNFNLKADKTLLISQGDKANLTTNLWHRNGVDGITVSYSVKEGSSYVTLKDNGDGSSTVTAKAEGMAVITCTASTGETEDIYILSEYHTLDVEEAVQTVPEIAASNWLYDHAGTTFNETEGAWEVTKRTDVVKSDDGNGNIVYYNNGFLSKSGSLDTSTYKYLLFRLKADRTTNFQVALNLGGYKYTYPSVAATNGGYVDVSVDLYTLASGGTATQFVLGITNHNDMVYIKDITLSSIPTYETELPEVKSVKIIKSVSTLSGDGASADVQAAAFSNKSSGVAVAWKSSSDCVAVKKNGNGTATLKALSDGTATITAYVSGDETVSESFNVTVSGQREKQAVYDIRILFWGASTTKHPPSSSLGWYGDWGMAASAKENDYVHKLVSYLEEEYYPSKVTFEIIANSEWDAAISPETDANKDWTTHAKYLEVESVVKTLKPNIIMTAQTGNMKADADGDVAYNAYKQMYDMMFSYCPDAIIVAQYCGIWHSAMKEEFMARLGKNYSDKNFFLLHNDVAGVKEYLAPEFENSGVANHWGDKGHERVAQQCFNIANPVIPSAIEPTYIYIPEEIEITGDTKVDEKGESLLLGIEVTPGDASADVVWSVDNSNIALISKNGLLTPLSNGTVTVTAKSAYNDAVTDTHTVVITNQLENFTLTYDAGTSDEVTGLPAPDEYAAGNYTLSASIPLRNAYTFVGWGLSENAAETVTTVNMTKPITVYAIWKKTDGFEFEGTYNEDSGFIYGFSIDGGFHNNIKNSNLYTTCTAGTKVTYKSPVLDIAAKTITFGMTSTYTDSTATVDLTVKFDGGQKVFTYPLTSDKFTTYTADLSDTDVTVTGFEIFVNAVPADNSMFEISLDFVRFTPITVLDGRFSATDGSVYISSLTFPDATEIVFNTKTDEDTNCITLSNGHSYNITGNNTVYVKSVEENKHITTNVLTYDSFDYYGSSATSVYTSTSEGIVINDFLTDSVTTYDTASLRINDPQGIRIKSSVNSSFPLNENISEYGFIVAKESTVTGGKINDLILNEDYISSKKVVYGKAFSRDENIYKVYEKNDITEFFTVVLMNVPKTKDALTTKLVFRPYVKLSDENIFYGAKVTRSFHEVALALYHYNTNDEKTTAYLKEILDICGYNNEIEIPLGSLYD